MELYVTCQRNGLDCLVSYEGQDEATVTRLLTELGATDIEFIAEETWMQANTAQGAS